MSSGREHLYQRPACLGSPIIQPISRPEKPGGTRHWLPVFSRGFDPTTHVPPKKTVSEPMRQKYERPKNPDQALLWLSTPSTSVNPARPNLMIVDISDVPPAAPCMRLPKGSWNQFFPGSQQQPRLRPIAALDDALV
jgi:hypothetical protein